MKITNTTQHPAHCHRRRLLPRLVLASLVGTIASFHLPGVAAESDPLDLDPNHQALVAREKIKQRGATRRTDARRGLQDNGSGNDANCGTVDIGNNTSESRSARGRVNPRDTTVIVTGPVINAARCK